ncbi:MAG: hypothetical protein ACLFN5_06320 [bacterium]
MDPEQLLIVSARRDEYSSLLESYPFKLKTTGSIQYFSYRNIRLMHMGIGPLQVKSTLSQLPADFFDCNLIIAGTAGSLSEKLRPGSVFISQKAIFDINRESFSANKQLCSRLKKTLDSQLKKKVVEGTLLTTSIPLISEKKRRMGAENYSAQAADMETGAFLFELEMPPPGPVWAGLRVISDSLETRDIKTAIAKQPTACRALGKILALVVEEFHKGSDIHISGS